MFYPVEYLKRGGRFYLCWVADSWPLRFATITHKQLWSQDIRDICRDLIDVMVVESGQPSARFSLRLSSQLMRGVVRLYQKKVAVFLGDLCMINAHVIKHINKKYCDDPPYVRPHVERPRLVHIAVAEVVPDNEEHIEERIRNSGNIVSNIEEITLKEAVIPEIQLPNDNFGEENPEQAFQLLNDRSVEVMLAAADVSAAQRSGLDALPAIAEGDKSHERSRLALPPARMERISDHDLTFRKSTAPGDMTLAAEAMEKEIPQIPEILPTELPVPSPVKELQIEQVAEVSPKQVPQQETVPAEKSNEELVLEELVESDLEPRRRRRVKKLIIDKHTKIAGSILRSRLENVKLELRCQNASEDIVYVERAWDGGVRSLMQRPAHAGRRRGGRGDPAEPLLTMFTRNIDLPVPVPTRVDTDPEMILQSDIGNRQNQTALEKIVEESGPKELEPPSVLKELEIMNEVPVIPEEVTEQRVSINVEQVDISDLPTQVLKTVSQEYRASKRRRAEVYDTSPLEKRQRPSGFVSFKLSQKINETNIDVQEKQLDPTIPADIADPALLDTTYLQDKTHPEPTDEGHVTHLLERAGLADAPAFLPPEAVVESVHRTRKVPSDGSSSETPLGSLDRTQVDLGDSPKTTDAQRFLRKEWGTQGTMLKVVRLLHQGVCPITVRVLVTHGPNSGSPKAIVAARCFAALLKLKQHNFVSLEKDEVTSEITDIKKGSRIIGNY